MLNKFKINYDYDGIFVLDTLFNEVVNISNDSSLKKAIEDIAKLLAHAATE